MADDPSEPFHFDPVTYLDLVRSEVPAYEALQEAAAAATSGRRVETILELGSGTGETAARVLALHPGADLVGIDENPAMLERATTRLPTASFQVGRLEDELPAGAFDLVVSALCVHHLDAAGKADLFARIAERLRAGGRFVLADLVVPEDLSDVVTVIDDPDHDRPSRVDEQLAWLADAGLAPSIAWRDRDLAVLVADRP